MRLSTMVAKAKVTIQSTPDVARSTSASLVAKAQQFRDDVNAEAEAIRSGE